VASAALQLPQHCHAALSDHVHQIVDIDESGGQVDCSVKTLRATPFDHVQPSERSLEVVESMRPNFNSVKNKAFDSSSGAYAHGGGSEALHLRDRLYVASGSSGASSQLLGGRK
jgi:hypothetical protein